MVTRVVANRCLLNQCISFPPFPLTQSYFFLIILKSFLDVKLIIVTRFCSREMAMSGITTNHVITATAKASGYTSAHVDVLELKINFAHIKTNVMVTALLDDTVHMVKELVGPAIKLKPEQVVLHYGGTECRDGDTLRTCNMYGETKAVGSLRDGIAAIGAPPVVSEMLSTHGPGATHDRRSAMAFCKWSPTDQDAAKRIINKSGCMAALPALTGDGVPIGFIDEGVDLDHPEFLAADGITSRIGAHRSFVEGQWFDDAKSVSEDVNNHGTHVIGLAAGRGGVAPGASIIIARLVPGQSTSSDMINAITWLINQGVRVINISCGFVTHPSSIPLENFVNDMTERYNVTFVCAMGNIHPKHSPDVRIIPACAEYAIAVGNCIPSDDGTTYAIASNSMRSPWDLGDYYIKPDLVAPGTNIESACHTNRRPMHLMTMSGTTMSTALVTGAVALLNQYQKLIQSSKRFTPSIIKTLLTTAARKPLVDNDNDDTAMSVRDYGHGCLNILGAIRAAWSFTARPLMSAAASSALESSTDTNTFVPDSNTSKPLNTNTTLSDPQTEDQVDEKSKKEGRNKLTDSLRQWLDTSDTKALPQHLRDELLLTNTYGDDIERASAYVEYISADEAMKARVASSKQSQKPTSDLAQCVQMEVSRKELLKIASQPSVERIYHVNGFHLGRVMASMNLTDDQRQGRVPPSSNAYRLDGTGVKVGIVDCGFFPGHPEFLAADGKTSRIKASRNFATGGYETYLNDDERKQDGITLQSFKPGRVPRVITGFNHTDVSNPVGDNDDHGTMTASIAVGTGGVAPAAEIYLARFSTGGTYPSGVTGEHVFVRCIRWLVDQGVDIIYVSDGCRLDRHVYDSTSIRDTPKLLERYCDHVVTDLNIPIIASMGNRDTNDDETRWTPACAKHVITIGNCEAIDGGDAFTGRFQLRRTSCLAYVDSERETSKPDLVAIGCNLRAATARWNTSGTIEYSYQTTVDGGTSASAAFVAGSIALMIQLYHHYGITNPANHYQYLLRTTAVPSNVPSSRVGCGAGVINIGGMVTHATRDIDQRLKSRSDVPPAIGAPSPTCDRDLAPVVGGGAATLPNMDLVDTQSTSDTIVAAQVVTPSILDERSLSKLTDSFRAWLATPVGTQVSDEIRYVLHLETDKYDDEHGKPLETVSAYVEYTSSDDAVKVRAASPIVTFQAAVFSGHDSKYSLVEATREELLELAALQTVTTIRQVGHAEPMRALRMTAMSFTQRVCHRNHRFSTILDGTGVKVGIVDCGFFPGHHEFLAADRKTSRIKASRNFATGGYLTYMNDDERNHDGITVKHEHHGTGGTPTETKQELSEPRTFTAIERIHRLATLKSTRKLRTPSHPTTVTPAQPSTPSATRVTTDTKFDHTNVCNPHGDSYSHGTHVTGIIAGEQGMAPNASIYLARYTRGCGEHVFARCIEWLIHQEVDVINISGGFRFKIGPRDAFRQYRQPEGYLVDSTQWLEEFCDRIINRHNVPIIAAMGNYETNPEIVRHVPNESAYLTPSCAEHVISVGNSQLVVPDDFVTVPTSLPAYSTDANTHKPDLVALGNNIVSTIARYSSTDVDYTTAPDSGTSMATAFVTGAVVLARHLCRSYAYTPDHTRFKHWLHASATKPKADQSRFSCGHGLLNISGLLDAVLTTIPPVMCTESKRSPSSFSTSPSSSSSSPPSSSSGIEPKPIPVASSSSPPMMTPQLVISMPTHSEELHSTPPPPSPSRSTSSSGTLLT